MLTNNHTTTKAQAPQLLEALACGKAGCPCRASANKGHGLVHCPAHADENPSLHIEEREGRVLVHCQAGCEQAAVIDALKERGLWPEPPAVALTVDELARAKGLDPTFLRGLGVGDGRAGRERQPCVDIPYCNEHGEVRAVHKRIRLVGEPRFLWRRKDHVLPYGLTRLREARAAGFLLLVEGETDAWSLWQAGIPALGMPGASTWRSDWTAYLEGIERVYVWREPDAGGDALAERVARDLPDVLIIEAPADAKDPNDLYLQDRAAFSKRMQALMAAARPASSLRAEALSKEARGCWEKAGPLLEDPALLDRVAGAIQAEGYAGDPTPPLLAYLALTSRLLKRPLNLAFIAPSAAGKNRAVDAALQLMPPTAYHLEKAGSARALIYNEDGDYQHRTVVVSEADSIPEEGPASSAIRALAADNSMSYDVVEKDPETGRQTTRHIEKPGPTGLITTAIKPLGEQMGTRLLAVGLSDTPEQTRAILLAHAASVNGTGPATDVDDLVAAQRWLELAGDRDVEVPFAPDLARAVPTELVRMRRDFRQLLTVIEAMALLHQRQRERDTEGHIVATPKDYQMARDLLLEVFTEAATGGVSRAVRETVGVVADLYDGATPVSVAAITERLRLHRSTTWRRVDNALRLGYLVNQETRPHQPAKLVPGAPLPEDRPALPEPSVVCACVDHPENAATLQHEAQPRIGAESEGPVATPVAQPVAVAQQEPPLQPALQQSKEAPVDSEQPSERPPVAVLHADPEDLHTQHLPPLAAPGDRGALAAGESSGRRGFSLHLLSWTRARLDTTRTLGWALCRLPRGPALHRG